MRLVRRLRRRFLMDPRLRDRLRGDRDGRDGFWWLRPRCEECCPQSRRESCLFQDGGKGRLLLLCGLRSSVDMCCRVLRGILLCLCEM